MAVPIDSFLPLEETNDDEWGITCSMDSSVSLSTDLLESSVGDHNGDIFSSHAFNPVICFGDDLFQSSSSNLLTDADENVFDSWNDTLQPSASVSSYQPILEEISQDSDQCRDIVVQKNRINTNSKMEIEVQSKEAVDTQESCMQKLNENNSLSESGHEAQRADEISPPAIDKLEDTPPSVYEQKNIDVDFYIDQFIYNENSAEFESRCKISTVQNVDTETEDVPVDTVEIMISDDQTDNDRSVQSDESLDTSCNQCNSKRQIKENYEEQSVSEIVNSNQKDLVDILEFVLENCIPKLRDKLLASSAHTNNVDKNYPAQRVEHLAFEINSMLDVIKQTFEFQDKGETIHKETDSWSSLVDELKGLINNGELILVNNDFQHFTTVIKDLKLAVLKNGTSTEENFNRHSLKTSIPKAANSQTGCLITAQDVFRTPDQRQLEDITYFKKSSKAVWCVTSNHDASVWFTIHGEKVLTLATQRGVILRTIKLQHKVYDVTVAMNGSLLISSVMDNHIRLLSADRQLSSFIEFKEMLPCGIHAATSGSIYVGIVDEHSSQNMTDGRRSSVVKLTPLGSIVQRFEVDEHGEQLFTLPYRIRENINGDLCVVDWIDETDGRLVVLSSEGQIKALYSGYGIEKNIKEFRPGGIACSSTGMILLCDIRNDVIHLLNNLGECMLLLTSSRHDGLYGPCDISLDKDSFLWVGGCKGDIQCLKYRE